MNPQEELERHKKLRSTTANRTDNIYELTRMRIVRVMREYEGDLEYAAEKLGCSRSTVRRYMNFVPFEHLMRDPVIGKPLRLAEHDREEMDKTPAETSAVHRPAAQRHFTLPR